ncbi:MAG: DsbA family protein [Nitrospirota bacterium]
MKKYFMVSLILSVFFSSGLVFSLENEIIKGRFTIMLDKPDTHERGKVNIIIFFDFFCPHCHKFDTKVVPLLRKEFGKKVNFVYLGYPLLYDDSNIPIEVYELAKDQGKGEEMKKLLFRAIYDERKDITDKTILLKLAKDIKLDVNTFEFGFDSHIKREKVKENIKLAKSYEVKGTPTVIIDGRIKVKENSIENIRTIINSILTEE